MTAQASAPRKPPIGPTEEEWRRMTPAERERFIDDVNDALTTDHKQMMSEGRPHKKAKARALDMLGLHFKTLGRVIYLAEEMSVIYPGEESFSPDILAVVGVEEPEDDERMSWVVADEGRGLDFVLEVVYHGNRTKDTVDNVERYARLGIPEYFIYDRAWQRIAGYRLPEAGAKRYQPILAQGGRYASIILGLDLAIQNNRLRFFHGTAELFDSANLIGRLSSMVDSLEEKAEQATAKAEQATSGLRDAILFILDVRGIVCPDEVRSRILSCDDPETLQRWLSRTKTCGSAEEMFGPPS